MTPKKKNQKTKKSIRKSRRKMKSIDKGLKEVLKKNRNTLQKSKKNKPSDNTNKNDDDLKKKQKELKRSKDKINYTLQHIYYLINVLRDGSYRFDGNLNNIIESLILPPATSISASSVSKKNEKKVKKFDELECLDIQIKNHKDFLNKLLIIENDLVNSININVPKLKPANNVYIPYHIGDDEFPPSQPPETPQTPRRILKARKMQSFTPQTEQVYQQTGEIYTPQILKQRRLFSTPLEQIETPQKILPLENIETPPQQVDEIKERLLFESPITTPIETPPFIRTLVETPPEPEPLTGPSVPPAGLNIKPDETLKFEIGQKFIKNQKRTAPKKVEDRRSRRVKAKTQQVRKPQDIRLKEIRNQGLKSKKRSINDDERHIVKRMKVFDDGNKKKKKKSRKRKKKS